VSAEGRSFRFCHTSIFDRVWGRLTGSWMVGYYIDTCVTAMEKGSQKTGIGTPDLLRHWLQRVGTLSTRPAKAGLPEGLLGMAAKKTTLPPSLLWFAAWATIS
jgi:hypothetical protein